jgi:hypothetical protein
MAHYVYHHPKSDVTPALIMKRIEAASGAKYSTHNEQARRTEPIAPVGTSYTPIGRPDVAAMRKAPAAAPPPAAPKPATGAPRSASSFLSKPTAPPAAVGGRNPAPADAWPEEKPTAAPPPPPAASRPPTLPSAPRPTPVSFGNITHKTMLNSNYQVVASQPASAPKEAAKPTEDDSIGPVGTNWQPVKLNAPKKLQNPFEAMQQRALADQQSSDSPRPSRLTSAAASTGGPKKLTWSERQALAKKQEEEENAGSKAAGWKGGPQTPVVSTGSQGRAGLDMKKTVGAAAVGGATVGAIGAAMLHQEEEEADEPAVRLLRRCSTITS